MNKRFARHAAISMMAIASLTTSVAVLWSADNAPGKIKFAALPAPVQKTFKEEAPQTKFESVIEETDEGKPVYFANALLEERNYAIRVAPDGTLIGKALDAEPKPPETEIKLADAPAAVQKTLKAEVKTGAINAVLKTVAEGKPLYGASALINKKPYWLTVLEDGTLLEKRLELPAEETEIELAKCPAEVRKLFKDEGEGAKLLGIVKLSEADKSVYRVAAMFGDKLYSITSDQDGTLIDKKLEIEPERAVVRVGECPAAVQKTLQAEAKGAEIDIVSKEAEDGKAVFTTEVKLAGKGYEIQVAEDGRLIYKVLSAEPEGADAK